MCGGIMASASLVSLGGSPVWVWSAMELSSLCFVGLLLQHGWKAPLKYLVPSAAGGAFFIAGSVSGSVVLVGAGLLLKLGMPPFHFWVLSAAEGCKVSSYLFVFLGPVKWAPLIALSWSLQGVSLVLSLFCGILGAVSGGLLALSTGAWHSKLALVGLSSTGWAISGSAVVWWLGPSFYVAYTAALAGFLGSSPQFSCTHSVPALNTSGFFSFLVLAGLPPGWVFLAKWSVVSGLYSSTQSMMTSIDPYTTFPLPQEESSALLVSSSCVSPQLQETGVVYNSPLLQQSSLCNNYVASFALVPLVLLAIAEFISWGVYLSVLISAWQRSGWSKESRPASVVCAVLSTLLFPGVLLAATA